MSITPLRQRYETQRGDYNKIWNIFLQDNLPQADWVKPNQVNVN